MKRLNNVKNAALVLFAAVMLAGCSTVGTVASRKEERAAAYAALPPDMRSLVDQGQIKVGMNEDAVYIAWGPPAQILQSENEAGKATTWIYLGGYVQTFRYWGYRQMHYDYYPSSYVRAQVVFSGGVVRSWQTFPEPVY